MALEYQTVSAWLRTYGPRVSPLPPDTPNYAILLSAYEYIDRMYLRATVEMSRTQDPIERTMISNNRDELWIMVDDVSTLMHRLDQDRF